MRIRRSGTMALLAGALLLGACDNRGGGDTSPATSQIEDNGVVPPGAIPAAPDVAPPPLNPGEPGAGLGAEGDTMGGAAPGATADTAAAGAAGY